jgi:uncharacterized damage-inducible protein DinB
MSPLAEAVLICDRINVYLLDSLDPADLILKSDKSKSVAGHLCHIHNVRLMWIRSILKECPLQKLDDKSATKEQIATSLPQSAQMLADIIDEAIAKGERVKGFKPSTEAFVGYLCAHDSFHRSQIELILRQNGKPLSDKIAYGMWEWGVR